MSNRRWCERCGNEKRFTCKLTLETSSGVEMHREGLVIQECDEEFYWIEGTITVSHGRGPSWTPGTGHIFCGPCGNNENIADSDIMQEDIKGYKPMSVLL